MSRRIPLVASHVLATTAAIVATALVVPAASAQNAAPSATRPATPAPNAPLDARAAGEVLDSVVAYMERTYVSRDTAQLIGRHLRERARAGAYAAAESPARFAELVTSDMRAVNDDLHLSLRFAPEGAASMGRPGPRGVEGGPGSAPGGEAPPPPPTAEEIRRNPFLRAARRQNYGLTRLEILPGNVGYLEISGFMGAPGVDQVVAHALRFLEGTDAIVIDLRRNGGGSGIMSHLVLSHFLDANPVPTIRVVNPAADRTTEMKSFATVPGPRRTDVPLYLLTSRRTASAAEEFSSVLKNLGRATVVGDRTAGAGHMVAAFNAGHGFVASISYTRVTDARTGAEWERVGVQPDVRVDPELALQAAHAAALRTIAAAAGDSAARRSIVRIAEALEAQLRPVAVDERLLSRYAGTYEGGREVRLVRGQLVIHSRPGALAEPMIPLGRDTFALSGDVRLSFSGEGGATRLTTETADGTRLSYARVSRAAAR